MITLDVRLFGQLNIHRADGGAVNLTSPRLQELFCYLVLKRGGAQSREALFGLFWGNSAPEQARRNLRQALWQLQGLLDLPENSPEDRLIRASAAWVQINPATALTSDVATFEEAYALADGVPGGRLDPQQAQLLQQAVELYRGDLLEGWYQDWCLIERERLQSMYLTTLDKLMSYCEAHQVYDQGLGYGERVLHYDRANERAHRRIMRLLYLAGDRSAALHQYERCVAALDADLGVTPSRRTSDLYRQIRSDTVQLGPRTDESAQVAPSHPTETDPLVAALDRIKHFYAAIGAIHAQLRQDLKTIEQALAQHRR